jgi:Flp pilus assembly protein TadB
VTVVCASLIACAAWLMALPPPDRRLARLLGGVPAGRAGAQRSGVPVVLAAVVGGLGAWAVVGGPLGVLLGVGCALAIPRAARRLETRTDRTRREQLERQAPLLADLMAAVLASGAPVRAALVAAGDAIGAPMSDAIRPVVAAIDLGAEPTGAWDSVSGVTALQPLVAALIRSAESGAPLSTVLARIAEDMRRDRQTAVEVAARSAGVRAVAPLAACFLPAFLLTGVVPVVASLAGELLTGA